MKKSFKFYSLIWAILLAVCCSVVFLVRPIIPGYVINYDAKFWIAFAFILVAFIGNIVCAYFAFKAENLKKMFLNIPLITVSWSALIVMIIVGAGIMLIPYFPSWIAAIICIVVLAINAIAVIKAVWVVDAVNQIDEKVKTQISFIKNLSVDAKSILARSKSDAVRSECKKVYDAVRYSDPMSSPELSVIEAKITVKMDELASAVGADNTEKVKEIAGEINILVGDRNNKCMLLK